MQGFSAWKFDGTHVGWGEAYEADERKDRAMGTGYNDASAFQPIIEDAKVDMWTAEGQADPAVDEKTLGTLVARWSGWDCRRVVEVCMAALEDANCHTECAALHASATKMGIFAE